MSHVYKTWQSHSPCHPLALSSYLFMPVLLPSPHHTFWSCFLLLSTSWSTWYNIWPTMCLCINSSSQQTEASLKKAERYSAPWHQHWGGSLTICPFKETKVLDSSPVPMISLVTSLWTDPQYKTWTPFCRGGLRSNQKSISYPQHPPQKKTQ